MSDQRKASSRRVGESAVATALGMGAGAVLLFFGWLAYVLAMPTAFAALLAAAGFGICVSYYADAANRRRVPAPAAPRRIPVRPAAAEPSRRAA